MRQLRRRPPGGVEVLVRRPHSRRWIRIRPRCMRSRASPGRCVTAPSDQPQRPRRRSPGPCRRRRPCTRSGRRQAVGERASSRASAPRESAVASRGSRRGCTRRAQVRVEAQRLLERRARLGEASRPPSSVPSLMNEPAVRVLAPAAGRDADSPRPRSRGPSGGSIASSAARTGGAPAARRSAARSSRPAHSRRNPPAPGLRSRPRAAGRQAEDRGRDLARRDLRRGRRGLDALAPQHVDALVAVPEAGRRAGQAVGRAAGPRPRGTRGRRR